MLEYFDEKLGKIKLVNVTEARANFAKLLADESHYYVITKNNKPQRVVISYEEFRDLRRLAEQPPAAGLTQSSIAQHKPTAEKNTAHKPYTKTPSRVKGLLTKHFQDPTPETPEHTTVTSPKTQAAHEPSWLLETTQNNSDDYFQTGEILNPEDVLVEDVANEQKLFNDISEDLAISEEYTAIDIPPMTENQQNDVEEEMEEEIELAQNIEAKTPQKSQRSPEEEEYYAKYRKLYESVPERELQESFEPRVLIENLKQREVKTILDPLPDLNVEAEEITKHFSVDTKPTHNEVAPPKFDLGMTQSLMDEKSDLPSLQELLRGLSSDDVSDSDLSEGEIDHIVKQIRHEE